MAMESGCALSSSVGGRSVRQGLQKHWCAAKLMYRISSGVQSGFQTKSGSSFVTYCSLLVQRNNSVLTLPNKGRWPRPLAMQAGLDTGFWSAYSMVI